MRYISICSGIEAASAAWHGLGWQCAAVTEIDPFASAVLAHRFPSVPNLGDFTKIEAHHAGPVDLLVGGTPCQSFSVAGKRAGLDDPRGNLTLEFLALARRLQPRWIVWENVPGVLSIDGGRTFGAFLGTLGQLGYGFAYRVLDAQHFGVPQRRRRVFVVGCAGGAWQRAAAVLFERDSLRGNPAPSRAARQNTAGALTASSGGCDENDAADGRMIAHSLRGEGFDASEDGTGRGIPLIADTLRAGGSTPASHGKQSGSDRATLIVGPLAGHHPRNDLDGSTPMVFAFSPQQVTSKTNRSQVRPGDPCHTLPASGTPGAIAFNARQDPTCGKVTDPLGAQDTGDGVKVGSTVRRLTPRECERLQGFPDDWTLVPYRGKPACDGPRYRAIGNSMAVPVMRWIGEQIHEVDNANT